MAGPIKPNDPNRRGNNPNGGGDDKKRSSWSFMSIVMWAVLLVFLLHMCSSTMESASVQSVPFSTFHEWMEAGYVEDLDVASNVYTFTLQADAPPLKDYLDNQKGSYGGGFGFLFDPFSSGSSDSSIKFQTAPLPRELAEWLS